MQQVGKRKELAAPIEIPSIGAIYTHVATVRYRATNSMVMYYGTMPLPKGKGLRQPCQLSEDALKRLLPNN